MILRGKITYNPKRAGLSSKHQKGWVTIEFNGSVDAMYRWFIEKDLGLKLLKPTGRPHISIIRGEVDTFPEKPFNGEYVDVHFDPIVHTSVEIQSKKKNRNTVHFFLKTKILDKSVKIRQHFGLHTGFKNCHLTIGKIELDKVPDSILTRSLKETL